ncbi:unnamed protein product [Periconia digitata]|uniref:Uncharacterized protein n=1 Tax=Periconia digitata TaxID=1303443 RepID=A0A9W4UD89_9PLEO|nr:unnamed protein product [Periconia digitata]
MPFHCCICWSDSFLFSLVVFLLLSFNALNNEAVKKREGWPTVQRLSRARHANTPRPFQTQSVPVALCSYRT